MKIKRALRLKGSHADVKAYALKLLGYRSRSRKEMRDRLKIKGFNDGHINNVIESLEDAGLINDETLASELLGYSIGNKSLGKKGIRTFLVKRGIDRELIEQTLSAHTSEMEVKSALEFVERKSKSLKNYPENVIKRRLWGMLQRRGFSSDVINMVVNSVKRKF